MATFSATTEGGLKELDAHLASRSYVASDASASLEDMDLFKQVKGAVDAQKLPHVHRWHKHLKGLSDAFPLRRYQPASAAKGRGGGCDGAKDKEAGGKGKDVANLDGLLPNAVDGRVVTRFPPEPSGYLHIGHAKAAMLNNYYARAFHGKLILRFDDTNPSKEKMEFEESIIKDLGTLQIHPDQVTHTSDHFEELQKLMEKVIKDGNAYVDNTEMLQMRAERDVGTESAHRGQSVAEAMRLFGEMLKGSDEGLKCCVRGKMDMQSKNKCLRDPVFYRCKPDVPHHRHGLKYKAYPTYDFACACVDSIEGVTHALRTIEYADRDAMYKWVQQVTSCRKVELVEFSKTQFSYTILSKRKLAWFVENGHVEGWNDPRFPTVQGILRRGMTVEGLMDFVMTQGMSKATNLMEWDKIWAINKQKIDPIIPRYAAVAKEGAVHLKLDGPKETEGFMAKRHPKNEELGERLLMKNKDVWIEQDDAWIDAEGEEVTLLHWGNVFLEKVEKNKAGLVIGLSGRLNPAGDPRKTKRKIHWIPKLEDQTTPIILREFDHILTKPKMEDDDEMADYINPTSVVDTFAIGDPMLKTLQKGDKLQLERRAYYIVDVPAMPFGPNAGKEMVLIKIPDGKAKDTGSIKSKIDPSKLMGSGKEGDKKEDAKKDGKADGKAEAKAKAKPDVKADGKAEAKAKAKAKAKAGDRPIADVTRLLFKVGKITKVWPHADAEKLYCEEIDLGEGEPRTICSGLRAHLTEEQILNKMVVVLANLKPKNMRGFPSQGMVMCATNAEGAVELLIAPDGAKIGERVAIEGLEMLDADEKLNEKEGKAPLPACSEGLRTTAKCLAAFEGKLWQTSAGPVTCKTADGTIS